MGEVLTFYHFILILLKLCGECVIILFSHNFLGGFKKQIVVVTFPV